MSVDDWVNLIVVFLTKPLKPKVNISSFFLYKGSFVFLLTEIDDKTEEADRC